MFNIFRAWYDDSDDDDILRIKDKFRLKSWIRVMVSVLGSLEWRGIPSPLQRRRTAVANSALPNTSPRWADRYCLCIHSEKFV